MPIDFDLTRHGEYLNRKYPGSSLLKVLKNEKTLYRLYLLIDAEHEFFVEAFLYVDLVECRFHEFKQTIIKVVGEAKQELTKQLVEDGDMPKSKRELN